MNTSINPSDLQVYKVLISLVILPLLLKIRVIKFCMRFSLLWDTSDLKNLSTLSGLKT